MVTLDCPFAGETFTPFNYHQKLPRTGQWLLELFWHCVNDGGGIRVFQEHTTLAIVL